MKREGLCCECVWLGGISPALQQKGFTLVFYFLTPCTHGFYAVMCKIKPPLPPGTPNTFYHVRYVAKQGERPGAIHQLAHASGQGSGRGSNFLLVVCFALFTSVFPSKCDGRPSQDYTGGREGALMLRTVWLRLSPW